MILRTARAAALWGITALVAASTMVAFGESYRALYLWAAQHDVPAGWALIWPAMVDTFVAVGELALFVALVDQWKPRSRLFAWVVTVAGLAVSVAANVGHVTGHAVTSRATAAVPPLAAAAALAVGLGVLKRVTAATGDGSDATMAATGSDTAATAATGSGRVRDILKNSPTLPNPDVAVMAGVDVRTVQRVKSKLNGAAK